MPVLSSYGQAVLQRCLPAMLARQELYAELLDGNQLGVQKAACYDWRLMAGWSRPAFAEERPVYTRSPTFAFGPRRRQTAVTLNRLQRSSTCRALSFSARSLCSPLRSKMA